MIANGATLKRSSTDDNTLRQNTHNNPCLKSSSCPRPSLVVGQGYSGPARSRAILTAEPYPAKGSDKDSALSNTYRPFVAFPILKSSIGLPDFNSALSQRGRLPRPAQVSDG